MLQKSCLLLAACLCAGGTLYAQKKEAPSVIKKDASPSAPKSTEKRATSGDVRFPPPQVVKDASPSATKPAEKKLATENGPKNEMVKFTPPQLKKAPPPPPPAPPKVEKKVPPPPAPPEIKKEVAPPPPPVPPKKNA